MFFTYFDVGTYFKLGYCETEFNFDKVNYGISKVLKNYTLAQ